MLATKNERRRGMTFQEWWDNRKNTNPSLNWPRLAWDAAKRECQDEINKYKIENEELVQRVCDECDGDGWCENRVEGRYPCVCVTETEPYQLLQASLAEKEAEMTELREKVRQLHEDMLFNMVVSVREIEDVIHTIVKGDTLRAAVEIRHPPGIGK